VNNLQ